MSSAAALSWFARHELRLAWREWLAMMTGGRRRRTFLVVTGLVIFAALMHLPAWAVIGRFADLRSPLDKTAAIPFTVTGMALLLSTPFIDVLAFFGGARWFAAFGVVAAVGISAMACAVAI